MMNIEFNKKGQALAPETVKMDASDFKPGTGCDIYWLGGGGAMLNCHGTIIMIDPVLSGFDMPLLRDVPVTPEEIEKVHAVLVTHIDSDHFSRETCKKLSSVCEAYHSTHYVAHEMQKDGIEGTGHGIGESFEVGNVKVRLTPVKHNWQNEWQEYQYREWKEEEYCGYWIDAFGKTIWMPGDSKLMEEHLHMPLPDVILFDFSEDSWHISLEGAVKLANAYPDSQLICIHYGCIDAPDMAPFNGNPKMLEGRIVNPDRVRVTAPGERFSV